MYREKLKMAKAAKTCEENEEEKENSANESINLKASWPNQ
jgi:hypothetical protein